MTYLHILCWTDNVLYAYAGGRHQNLVPTNCYIKACVTKKSFSSTEDAKKIRKELGIKPDDVRNYFQPSKPLEEVNDAEAAAAAASAVAAANEKY
jgi:hypothetical protein